MARQPSKILTAAELKVAKTEAKAEVNTHAAAIKAAEKAIKDAKKILESTNKTVEAAFAKAQKDHVAGLKAASKAFETVQKAQSKIIEGATKLGVKAEAKVAALAPKVEPKPELATA
jgi:4'-phosphopantetheinyl transferase EntD